MLGQSRPGGPQLSSLETNKLPLSTSTKAQLAVEEFSLASYSP